MNTTSHRMVTRTAALLFACGAVAADPVAADPTGPDPWADKAPGTIITVSEEFSGHLMGVAVRPDGTAHVVQIDAKGTLSASRLVAVRPDGDTTTVAGGPGAGYPFESPRDIVDVETGRDGSLYVVGFRGPLLRLHPDGTPTLVAGGQLRAAAKEVLPIVLASAPDGTVYVGDGRGPVYELNDDGTLRMVVDGLYRYPSEIAADAAGNVYVTSNLKSRVYRVHPDGEVTAFAGRGENSWDPGNVGDGGPATEADVPLPNDVAVDSDGSVYVSDLIGLRRVAPDGTISTVVERGAAAPDRLAFDPHGNLYFTDDRTNQLKVLVRPAEIPESAEIAERAASGRIGAAAIVAAVGSVLAVAAVVLVVLWVRRRRPVGGPPRVRS